MGAAARKGVTRVRYGPGQGPPGKGAARPLQSPFTGLKREEFINCCFYFLFLLTYRARGRERNIGVQERHCLVVSQHPQLGTWPTTQARALTGNQTSNLSVCRLHPLSHTSQSKLLFLKIWTLLPLNYEETMRKELFREGTLVV